MITINSEALSEISDNGKNRLMIFEEIVYAKSGYLKIERRGA
ncbi:MULTISPECIES: hypothetical protein [unclassified Bartonella]